MAGYACIRNYADGSGAQDVKIYLPKFEPNRKGGGWTFQSNLYKTAKEYMTTDYSEADIYFIAGASMLDKEEVRQAKSDGKKIVLRVDNMPRNSRNRNSGSSRLKLYSELADLVIYQSEWAKNFLEPFLGVSGPVILNGVDTSIFNAENRVAPDNSYLYVRSSRDEGKQWIMAWYWFAEWNNKWEDLATYPVLEIVGQFSPDNIEYKFDFFNGEQFRFMGVQKNMADIYKRNRYFLYSYTNDACSNTLIEARASGCEIIDVYGMLSTGGAPEIMALEDLSLERMGKEYLEAMSGL